VGPNNAITLTLLKDYTLPEHTLCVYGNLTLDFGGHTLTTQSPSDEKTPPAAIFLLGSYSEASLTLLNGTLNSNARAAIWTQGASDGSHRAKLTLQDVTINEFDESTDYPALYVSVYSDCTIQEGTHINGTTYAVAVYGNKTNSNAITETDDTATTLTVNGGTISAKSIALSGNGIWDNTRITINGGEITAENGTAIYHPQVGDLTIKGGTITGGMGVQYTGAGTLTINSNKDSGTEPTIKATAAYTAFPSKSPEQKDGTIVDGAALSIVSRGKGYQDNSQTIKVNISGGDFISEYNSAVAIYRIKKVDNQWTPYMKADIGDVSNYLSDISITGGTFTAAAADAENPNKVSVLTIDEAANDAFKANGITGGTFLPLMTATEKDTYLPATHYQDSETGEVKARSVLSWYQDASVRDGTVLGLSGSGYTMDPDLKAELENWRDWTQAADSNYIYPSNDTEITSPDALVAYLNTQLWSTAYRVDSAPSAIFINTPAAQLTIGEHEIRYYPTLEDAIAAAADNTTDGTATVTLLKRITLDAPLVVTGKVTLDLNGITLFGPDGKWAIRVEDGGDLTLKNGKILSENGDGVRVRNASSLTLNDVNITVNQTAAYSGYGVYVLDNATADISNSEVTAYCGVVVDNAECAIDGAATKITGNCAAVIFGSNDATATPTTLTINDGTLIGNDDAIAGNGSWDYTRITINGGTLQATGGGPAIYHPQVGDLTINGGTIEGVVSGVQYCGAGTLTITGGTLKATAEAMDGPSKPDSQTDGSVDDGAALSIVSRGKGYQDNSQTIKVNISGGDFISDHNSAVAIYRINRENDKWVVDAEDSTNYLNSISITGGTFTAAAEDEGSTVPALRIDEAAAKAFTATVISGITGGTFLPLMSDEEKDTYLPATHYQDSETGEVKKRVELKWAFSLGAPLESSETNMMFSGKASVIYPADVSDEDKVAVEKQLKAILDCTEWIMESTPFHTWYRPAELPVLDADGTPTTKTQTFDSSTSFIDYINTTLLADRVGSGYYHFAYGFTAAGKQNGNTLGGSDTIGGGAGSSIGDGSDTIGGSDGGDNIGDGADSSIIGVTNPASDEGEGSGSISDSDAALGVVSAPNSGSGSGSISGSGSGSDAGTAVVAMAAIAAVGGITLAANWDKLPVHKVQGTLTDATGAAVANATVTLEKNGEAVKTVTTDASGHFKAFVPQGEYDLIATVGDETAIYTAYTPGKGNSAELALDSTE
jgi:hypothetical protein